MSSGLGKPQFRAMGRLKLSASAVPSRAMATCSPIARAISLPENQRTTTLDTVMPHIS